MNLSLGVVHDVPVLRSAAQILAPGTQGYVAPPAVTNLAEGSQFKLGSIDAKGAVSLTFKGGAGTVNTTSVITSTIKSTNAISLVSDGPLVNKINFDSGNPDRVAGAVKLIAGGDITVESKKPFGEIHLTSRVISEGGKVTLKMATYSNVESDAASAGNGKVWDTTNQTLVLPFKAAYTDTYTDTGLKTTGGLTSYSTAFETGSAGAELVDIDLTKRFVIRDDLAGGYTLTDADRALGFAQTDVKTMTQSGLFVAAGSSQVSATLSALFSTTNLVVDTQVAEVVFHELGTTTGFNLATISKMKSLVIHGNLTTDATNRAIGIITTGGGVTSTGTIDGTNLTITSAGAVNLAAVTMTGTVGITTSTAAGTVTTNGISGTNLTIDATGAISLSGATAMSGTVGITTTAGGVTSTGAISGTNLTITSAGAVSLTAATTMSGTVGITTSSGGVTSTGAISGTDLSVQSAGAISLTGSNMLDTVKVLSAAGNISLKNAKHLILDSENIRANTDNFNGLRTVILDITGNLTLNKAVLIDNNLELSVTGSYVGGSNLLTATGIIFKTNLNAGSANTAKFKARLGSIAQETGTVITAGNLELEALNTITLEGNNQINQIDKLITRDNISLTNAKNLILNSDISTDTDVNSAATVTIKTTTGGLTLNQAVAVNGILKLDIAGTYSSGATNFLLSANSIRFERSLDAGTADANFKTIGTLVNINGTMTQAAGAIITAGKLFLDSNSSITLTEANQIIQIEKLNGTGNISLTNARNTILNSNINGLNGNTVTITTTNSGNLVLSKDIVVTGNLNLSVAGRYDSAGFELSASSIALKSDLYAGTGDIKLKSTDVGITQDAGKVITANKLFLDSKTGITLGEANLVTSIEQLKSVGAITFVNNKSLTLNSVIDSSNNPISIKVTGNLTVKSGLAMTSNGNLTLTISGKFIGNKGTDAWDLGGKTLSGTISEYDGLVGDTVFKNLGTGTGALASSFNRSGSVDRVVNEAKNLYFTSKYKYTGVDQAAFLAYETYLQELYGDTNLELHNLGDIAQAAGKTLQVDSANTSLVKLISVSGVPDTVKTINIVDSTGRFGAKLGLDKINFYGMNRLSGLDISGGASNHAVTITVKENSSVVITGALDFGDNSGEIVTSSGSTFSAGSVTANTTVKVTHNSYDNLNLSATRFAITAGGLTISSIGGAVNLGNRGNSITGNITGMTNGGALVLAGGNLTITSLKTGGGSLSLASTGSIDAQGLEVGSVNYSASGNVKLKGSLASASGSGQSVKIESSSAALVLGDNRSDGAIDLTGTTGTTVLAGNLSSQGGNISFGEGGTDVVRDSSVNSNGGTIKFGSSVDSSTNSGLIINAGENGTVELLKDIGKKKALKWVEIDANMLNAISVSVSTVAAAAGTTTVGMVGSPRQGDVMMNLINFNGSVSIPSSGIKTKRTAIGVYNTF